MDFKTISIFPFFVGVCIASLLLICSYLLTLPYKLFALGVARLFRPDLGALICKEASYFHHQSNNLVSLNHYFVLEGELKLSRLTRLVSERITEVKTEDGSYRFSRLREYFSEFMGFDIWKTDRNFHVSNHIQELKMCLVKGSGYCTTVEEKLDKIQAAVGGLSTWKEEQSQWEMILVSLPKEDKTIFITRVHHSLMDGFSHRFMYECLFQIQLPLQPRSSPAIRVWNYSVPFLLAYPWRMMWDTAKSLQMVLLDQNKLWHCKDFGNVDCISAFSNIFRIYDIKQLRKRFGVEYNTVIFYAVARAFTRLRQEAGETLPSYTSVTYLGPKPNHPKITTNHFYLHYMRLPNPIASLAELNVELLNSNKSLYSVWVDVFLGKMALSLPTQMKRVVALAAVDSTVVITNFIPLEVSEFEGHTVLDVVGSLGYRPCRNGLNIAVTGVHDKVRLCVLISRTIAPDDSSAHKLMEYAWEELQLLMAKGR